jgi:periplasmic protein TonB
MRGTLFSELVVSRPGAARAGRWAGPLPVSVVLHGGALAALLLVPLMNGTELPPPPGLEPRIRYVPGPTPPPPVVRLDPARGGGRPRLRPPGPPKIGRPFVAPAVVPATLVQDQAVTDEVPAAEICVGCVLDPGVPPGPGDRPGVGDGDGDGPAPGPPGIPRAGIDIQEPRKLRHVAPIYPPLAENVGIGATVILECRIDTDGRVADIKVLRGHALFDAAAVAAVRHWAYTPTLLNGQPVSILMTVTVRFISRR